MKIEIKNLNFSYNNLKIFEKLDLSINRGEVTVLLGPSGCGKTTLLNLISKSILPESGEILTPEDLELSYIFQEPRLLPWLNVEDNILFVMDSVEEGERKHIVTNLLNELELTPYREYYPAELSGGMKQRVSIARAIAFPSNTLLMDEPFKGLDLTLKISLFNLFNRVWRGNNKTAIFVTHDIQEAIQLGDKIVLLTQTPVTIKEIYTNPLPYTQRKLHKNEIIDLEKDLYKLII